MLSRVAGSLYRLAALIERCDHAARVLDVHVAMALDRPRAPAPDFWTHVLELLSMPAGPRHVRETIDAVVVGPGQSITGWMNYARREGLAVRPNLSSEVYESINDLHWSLVNADPHAALHDFSVRVMRGAQLFWGLVDDTMAHDEAWQFLRLGRQVERADNVVRLVTTKLRTLPADDAVEWAAALRSCSAFESYRWRFSAPVTPSAVAGFLLFDQTLPRSARHAVGEALEAVRRIDAGRDQTPPHRLLGRLSGLFEYTTVSEVENDPSGFAIAYGGLSLGLRNVLESTYLRPSHVAAGDPVVPPPIWVTGSQQ